MLSTMTSRSTKGASKQRRENINSQITTIRDLMPIQEQIRNRLSQLQVMSLCKAYIGKSNLLNSIEDSLAEDYNPFDFTQAIPGFLMITDLTGRIFYVSDNVTDYLAHSMVDVITQAETVYELLHSNDHPIFRSILSYGDQSPSIGEGSFSFTCRMGMLRHLRRNPTFDRYKKMRIFGRKIVAGEHAKRVYFVALCTPRLNPMMASDPSFVFDTMVFKSVHALDMKFINIDHNGEYHLGYSSGEIASKSWYEMIHPDDIEVAMNKHKELIHQVTLEATCSLSLRVQSKSGEMLCLQLILKREQGTDLGSSEGHIVCWNQVVCPNEMGADDKEELLHQMNTINYLDQYCSSQTVEKKVFYTSNGSGVVKEKKCDRSELMERLKRKMQKPEVEKTKLVKLENPIEGMMLKNSGVKFKSTPMDLVGLLPNQIKNGNLLFSGQIDLTNFGMTTGSSMTADNRLIHASPTSLDNNLLNNALQLNNDNLFNFATTKEIVTMPTPERQQTWSPPVVNYIVSSPGSEDLNNQSFFSGARQEFKQESIFVEEKRSSFPELKPHEVDEFFEMEAHFLADVKDETFDQFRSCLGFDYLDGAIFTEQVPQSFLQQLSAF